MIARTIRLEAERIYLRFPKRGDLAQWSEVRSRDRDHLMPWEPLWGRDANSRRDWRIRLETWKRAWKEGRGYAFLIFEKTSDELCGGIALTQVRHGSAQTGTMGYWLAADAQGGGLMSEAVGRLCRFGGQVLGLQRIEAATVIGNTRSQAVLERNGFEREGVARSYLQIAGTRQDHILFGKVLFEQASGGTDEQSS